MEYYEIDDSQSLTDFLSRDPNYIKRIIQTTKDNRVVATKDIDIVFPEFYFEKNLAKMDNYFRVIGIVAFIDPVSKKYSVMNIPTVVLFHIPEINHFVYNDVKYFRLSYRPGDTIIHNLDVMVDNKIEYYIFHCMIGLGHIPWYMNYDDVIKLTELDYHYFGEYLGATQSILELIYSTVARNPDNDKFLFNSVVKDPNNLVKEKPKWVGIRNISLGAVDTASKIMGSYFDEGLTSAIAEPSKKLTPLESVLRS